MKSLFLNLLALALFSAFAAASGILTTGTLLFQLAAQWLVNELWFDACLVPVLFMHLFGRKGEGRDDARLRRAARWTSFCLLLIPAVLFALLSLVEGLSSDALSRGLGLPLGSGLYACSFAGFVLLFILSLFAGATPLSVQAALEKLLDTPFEDAKAEIREAVAAAHGAAACAAVPAAPSIPAATAQRASIPCRHSRLYAAHEQDFARKLQPGEELILATAPAGDVPMGGEWQAYLFGGGFGAAGLFLLSAGYSLQQSGELVGLALWLFFLMGAAFLFFALPVLVAPLRWRKRLSRIDYFITNRRLLIYRGDELHIQPWDQPCGCYLIPRGGSRGDVAVIRKGVGYHIMRGFFKRWADLNEEETRLSFDQGRYENGKDAQTQALINVEGAQDIHALITELLNKARPGQPG